MKTQKKNYRKIYSEYYCVELRPEIDIHHIDGNKNNNNPQNLVALPRELHNEYHTALSKLKTNFDVQGGFYINFNLSFHDPEETLSSLLNAVKGINAFIALRNKARLAVLYKNMMVEK